jgi:hypothetical protein
MARTGAAPAPIPVYGADDLQLQDASPGSDEFSMNAEQFAAVRESCAAVHLTSH